MKMRLHQFLSAALALCLALTLNVPLCAAAADLPTEDDDLVAVPETPDDLIEVTVPATGQITINPYRMHVVVDAETGETSRDQIVHQAQTLVNHTDFPVAVNVSLSAAFPAASNARFVTAPPDRSSQEKDVFLYVEFQNDPDQWLDGYVGADNQLIVTDQVMDAENVMTLAPNGQGSFHFSGAMAAGDYPMWSADDAFSVNMVFSFTSLYTEEELEEAAEEADETDAEEVEDGEAEEVEAPADAEEAEPSESTDAAEPADEPSETNADAAPANGEAQADNGEAKADADASEAEGTADPANADAQTDADQANGETQADADEAKADAATGEASEAQADADAAPADSNANSTTGNAFGKEDADAGESKSDAAPVESQGTDEFIELTPDDTPDAEPLQ
jgi:chemotaxis protein histidine kinase CheA